MIEVYPNLYIGDENDEMRLRGQAGWYFVRACKEPYHRDALGYTGRAAANTHPEYLIAYRDGRLILNLVDVDNVAYVSPLIVDAAIEAIHKNLPTHKVLLHCNQGMSRSPTIGALYLAAHTDVFAGQTVDEAVRTFRGIYPSYNPKKGAADYLLNNWAKYATRTGG